MSKSVISAALCAACLLTVTPVLAAGTHPAGQAGRDVSEITESQIKQQHKENKEANHNVDRLITNRK